MASMAPESRGYCYISTGGIITDEYKTIEI